MRTLFSTITVLGFLLAVLSIFEIRVVREYQSKVRGVQDGLTDWEKREQAEAKRRGIVITGTSIAYMFGESIDRIDRLERGWLAAACISGGLIIAGGIGFIIERRSRLRQSPSKLITGANPGGPRMSPMWTAWAARVAQFYRYA